MATTTENGRTQMTVYAARNYSGSNYRSTNMVKVNLPDIMPLTPQDDKFDRVNFSAKNTLNTNFPACTGQVKLLHYREFPIFPGAKVPLRFPKGTEFLLSYPSGIMDDGHLLHVN